MAAKYFISAFMCGLLLQACKPVLPVTSSIVIDMEKPQIDVNRELYGLTLEEINHAVEGGLCAELIRNGSFEAGIAPDGCSYEPSVNILNTPSGWRVPFVPPNATPGWRALNERTTLYLDTWSSKPNEINRRSLWVYIPYQAWGGGVAAEGFGGISVREGEKYDLSLLIKGREGARVKVELRDAMAGRPLSDPFYIRFTHEWTRVRHTFTAHDGDPRGLLVFGSDSSVMFNIDMVSLLPSETGSARRHGLRADLMEALEALNPQFVRFPGGASVEGYAPASVPAWEEALAPPEQRRVRWSMYGYETHQAMGLHEYLQLCEDLQASPVYVANAGLLNQRYRTRYQEQSVDYWAEQLRTALAYAREPADSAFGRLRSAGGHDAPFGLNRIEIGSEHRGREYLRHYRRLRDEAMRGDPDLTLICNSLEGITNFSREWVDSHCNASVEYLIAAHDCFDLDRLTIRTPMRFVGEFGASYSPDAGTLRAAVGEAAFLTGMERNPRNVKGIAYSPLLGHAGFPLRGTPAILFDASRTAKSPSYHVLKMFADNRGDKLLATTVDTYNKSLVKVGFASIILYDYQYGVKDVAWNGQHVRTAFVRDRRTNLDPDGLQPEEDAPPVLPFPEAQDPEAQRKDAETPQDGNTAGQGRQTDVLRRYMTFGDPAMYNYTVSVSLREVQAGGMIEIRVRDNGLAEESADHISLTFKDGNATLYYCSGRVSRPLAEPAPVAFDPEEWRKIEIVCNDRAIQCYMDGRLLIDAVVPLCPTLLTVATHETETHSVILKVVNTSFHEEWCSLDMRGESFRNEIETIQLTGLPEGRNTLEDPDAIVPKTEKQTFSFRRPLTYAFPPNSVTILKMKLK
ncbi:MAG: glycoside hydrolase [Tannerella sp.]|nr:glycoside hydrolase [Tannerella sp.]